MSNSDADKICKALEYINLNELINSAELSMVDTLLSDHHFIVICNDDSFVLGHHEGNKTKTMSFPNAEEVCAKLTICMENKSVHAPNFVKLIQDYCLDIN